MTIEQVLKSKTMLFAILLAALSAGQALIVQLPLPPIQQGLIGMAVSVAIAALRVLTTVPLSEK